jgi:hypothetical protein
MNCEVLHLMILSFLLLFDLQRYKHSPLTLSLLNNLCSSLECETNFTYYKATNKTVKGNCTALLWSGIHDLVLELKTALAAAEPLEVAWQPLCSLTVLVVLNCVWAVILNPCSPHCFTLVYSHLEGYPGLYFISCLAPLLRLNVNFEVICYCLI